MLKGSKEEEEEEETNKQQISSRRNIYSRLQTVSKQMVQVLDNQGKVEGCWSIIKKGLKRNISSLH